MSAPMLLTDSQMQRFIAHGYLQLQTLLPESFHRGIFERFDRLIGGKVPQNPGNNLLPLVPELNRIFADPVVRGALTSVIGPDYVMHPHRALHNNPPGSDPQRFHKDSYWGYQRRVRNHHCRWAMIMYVPQATPLERGPTGVVPGSHYQMQQPNENLMAEMPGRLEAGGFLLIHYDIWHRKMKNSSVDKRFMMKFEFVRMHDPISPSWDHRDPAWRLTELPSVDLSAVWRRQWDWLRNVRPGKAASNEEVDAAMVQPLHAAPKARLQAISAIARNTAAVRRRLPLLAAALRDDCEPIAIAAAYAIAGVGADALPVLLEELRRDYGDDLDASNRSYDGGQADPGWPSLAAAHGLVEVGLASVPAALELLVDSRPRVRMLAAFVLGEIGDTTSEVTAALCRSTTDAEAMVRINAVEALGLKRGTPRSVSALSTALQDDDPQVRFSAALSLAQIGPDAEAAVPALREALMDDNRYVLGCAVEALDRIGTADAMRALLPFLKLSRWCPYTSPRSIF
jgi:HEAT repeat protein